MNDEGQRKVTKSMYSFKQNVQVKDKGQRKVTNDMSNVIDNKLGIEMLFGDKGEDVNRNVAASLSRRKYDFVTDGYRQGE